MTFTLKVTGDFSKASEQTLKKLDRGYRRIVLEVFKRVIFRTPVDTGRARGNWQCSVGKPSESIIDILDKDGGSTFSRASGMVSAIQKMFSEYWLSNNLPYIGRLEYGWSQQAPSGMVRLTVAEFDGIVKEIQV
jgi:hypothetical protein